MACLQGHCTCAAAGCPALTVKSDAETAQLSCLCLRMMRVRRSSAVAQDSSEDADSSEDVSDSESAAPQASVLAESNAEAATHSTALKSRLGRRCTRGATRRSENVQPA